MLKKISYVCSYEYGCSSWGAFLVNRFVNFLGNVLWIISTLIGVSAALYFLMFFSSESKLSSCTGQGNHFPCPFIFPVLYHIFFLHIIKVIRLWR